MSLYLAEDRTVILQDDEVFAVLQHGFVEVYDEMGEFHYGCLPKHSTAEDVKNAMKFFNAGLKLGKELGQGEAKSDIRKALGL